MLPNDIDTGVFTDEALTIITSMQQDGVMKGELQYKTAGYPPKQDYAPFINVPKACSFTDERDEKEFARRFIECVWRITAAPICCRRTWQHVYFA